MSPLLPIILGAASLIGLLAAIHLGAEEPVRVALKGAASVMFVLTALLRPRPEPRYFRLVLMGLLAGLVGDVLLELDRAGTFLAGLVAFLIGHVFYAQAFFRAIPARRPLPPGQVPDAIRELDRTGTYLARLVASLFGLIFQALAFFRTIPARRWLTPWQIPVVLAALAVAARVLPRAGEMLLPVILYIAIITIMVCGAVAALRAGGRTRGFGTLVVLGSVLFFFSDYLVAMNAFVERTFLNTLLLLPAYYAAQFMLAWSVGLAGPSQVQGQG